MKIKKLVKKGLINKDHWLAKAQVKNENVDFINGKVFWENGTWKDGVWKGGTWKNGIWENGIWKDGVWKDGIWKHGHWKDGIWENGIWEFGTWKNGIWKFGTWEFGIWKNGIWKEGTWENGLWEDGVWEDGFWEIGIWRSGIWKNGWELFGRNKWKTIINRKEKLLKVGCKVKTYKEWEEWLNSDEKLQTPRNSEDFKPIEKTIRDAILILKAENGKG